MAARMPVAALAARDRALGFAGISRERGEGRGSEQRNQRPPGDPACDTFPPVHNYPAL